MTTQETRSSAVLNTPAMSRDTMRYETAAPAIFERLGVVPVVNCCGVYTDLGGSVLSPSVWAAMAEVNTSFVDMIELLHESGQRIAAMVGAEAARVVPGASAAIALGTAACIARSSGAISEQLPNTGAASRDVLLQSGHGYKYDRCVSLAGGRIVRVGDDNGATLEMLDSRISADSAMMLLPAHLDGVAGTVPLRDAMALARRRELPTFVDAAYMNYPTSLMGSFTAAGADLVCFSAKYFGGPNAGGFICGRRDLLDAVTGVDFTRYESGQHLKFGRAFKLDRQTIVAVVVALEEWFAMDHGARWQGYSDRVQTILSAVRDVDGVQARSASFTMDERLVAEPVNCVMLEFDAHGPWSAETVATKLAAGNPSVRTVQLNGSLVIAVDALLDGQETLVADRLKIALGR